MHFAPLPPAAVPRPSGGQAADLPRETEIVVKRIVAFLRFVVNDTWDETHASGGGEAGGQGAAAPKIAALGRTHPLRDVRRNAE